MSGWRNSVSPWLVHITSGLFVVLAAVYTWDCTSILRAGLS
jgi:hypothetical protein